ncbi:glycerophosphocholine choline phosphodiesterase ENPP6-like [Liolophura sinensis]|uniref:glycerophosphocholine choline phosphodiesterase ENPP6-like n=1 Tax=Liolophura sinensis TaxID=3198878 RepID=UPI003158FFBF
MDVLCSLCILSLIHVASSKPLMILYLDGFRWDYLDIHGEGLRGFPQLQRMGVQARHVMVDFPTLSLPNQYTFMTGLYNEYHGMVSDSMYDPDMTSQYFPMDVEPDPLWWRDAEPLWIAAEKQNKTSYFYHWPYCNVINHRVKATHCKLTTGITTAKKVLNAAEAGLSLLANSTAELIGIFVDVGDSRAHRYGTNSTEVKSVIRNIDNTINKILEMMRVQGLTEKVTLMVVSGHGITDVSRKRIIRIKNFVDTADVDIFIGRGAFLSVWPKPEKMNKVYNLLRGAHVNLTTYRKEDTPENWHFRHHPRIPPIVVVAEKGWTILKKRSEELGNHGYDNNLPDMRGFFLVAGPDFKSSYVSDPIELVDVYQVICKVLGMASSPHNGTWARVRGIFKSSSDKSAAGLPTLNLTIVGLCVSLIFRNE